jgi:hypothetical protein
MLALYPATTATKWYCSHNAAVFCLFALMYAGLMRLYIRTHQKRLASAHAEICARRYCYILPVSHTCYTLLLLSVITVLLTMSSVKFNRW